LNFNILLEQLIDIQRSIGVETDNTIRKMLLDAQESLVTLQKQTLDVRRKEPRRVRLEDIASSSKSGFRPFP
jgi:hypothetical protein